MPLFEYLCKDCGKSFERIVPRYDSSTECAHCDSRNIEKQLSVFAIADPSSSSNEPMAAGGGCGQCGAAEPGMCRM